MKVFPPAPGRTRNSLSVENERKIFLGAWKQAGHSIAANSFQGPGRRLQVLHGLAADVFIHGLDQVVTGDESLPLASRLASAVFFHPPHHGGAMNLQARRHRELRGFRRRPDSLRRGWVRAGWVRPEGATGEMKRCWLMRTPPKPFGAPSKYRRGAGQGNGRSWRCRVALRHTRVRGPS